MSLDYIYASFQALTSIEDKVKFLQEMDKLDLPYEINWQNLVNAWKGKAESEL
jgi:hypothetical protein